MYFKLEKTNKYSNKEDKEEINEFICSEGYFLFTDHLNNSSCYKCSIDKCKTCVGDIDKNTCLICINSYNPKYNNNTIISCDFKESKKLICQMKLTKKMIMKYQFQKQKKFKWKTNK